MKKRMFLLASAAVIAIAGGTASTGFAEAGCWVNVGHCASNGNCVVNKGTCDGNGNCVVSIGHCGDGDSDLVAL